VQIVPASVTLAYEKRRGRLDSAELTLTAEANESFGGVYSHLEPPLQLLLHAAAFLTSQHIPREELKQHLAEADNWSDAEFERRLDACFDLHLLEGGADLRMHQLFASFVLATPISAGFGEPLQRVRIVQGRRLVELARELAASPNRAELAAALMAFPLVPLAWEDAGAAVSIQNGEQVGRALYEIGRFEAAQPWFERAVTAKEKNNAEGRVDHPSLGYSLHCVGYCLSSMGQFEAARPWFERAVAAHEKGDIHGRVDRGELGKGLYQVGICLSSSGEYEAARPWYERAVEAQEKGDIHGRVDHGVLGKSLH
jgi:tetratricopeptide (TPR) repeat protein